MKFKTKSLILMVLIIALLVLFGTNSSAAGTFKIDKISAIVNDTNAKIEWTDVDGATGYEVYVELPAIGYQYIGTVKSNGVQIIGFEQGTTYGVKVRAYKENGSNITYSDFSQEVNFKYGEDEEITSTLGTIGKIEAISYGTTGSLKWNKVDNADGYEIYASVGNGNFIDMGTTTSTEIKVIGMDKNRVYTIKIRPFMDSSEGRIYGSFSELAILKFESTTEEVKVNKVYNFRISVVGTKANLSWNSVSNADGYEVLVEMPEGTNAVYSVDTNKLTLQNFSAGYTYKAKVRAYKYVNGNRVYGDYSSLKNITIEEEEEIKLDRVTNLQVKVTGETAKFTWNRVSGASGYELEIYDPDRGYLTTTTTTISKTITGFDNPYVTYTVRVRAYKNVNGNKVYGEYSNVQYFWEEQIKVDKVTNVVVTTEGEKAKITWSKVSGASGYELEIYDPDRGYLTTTTTTISKTIAGFDNPNVTYAARVRAYKNVNGNKVYGEYSNVLFFWKEQIKLDKVTNVIATTEGEKAKITWNKVSEANGYEIIMYKPDGSTYTTRTTSTSKTFYNIEKDGLYSVQVRAYANVSGQREYGDYSDKLYFIGGYTLDETAPGQVTGVNIIRNGENVTFMWNPVSDALGYEMKIYTREECAYRIETYKTMETIYGIPSTENYIFSVRAFKYINGEKVYSQYATTQVF